MCGHLQSLWQTYLHSLVRENPLHPAIAVLGLGGLTILSARLEKDRPLLLDFTAHGVPEDAIIFHINMTPELNDRATNDLTMWPAISVQDLQTGFIPRVLTLHPVPLNTGAILDGVSEMKVNILALWAKPPVEPEQEALFTAAKAFTNGDYRGAVIPAQVAMELKLNQVLTSHYNQFGGRESVHSFLQNGASYGYQLRYLMPSLFKIAGAPPLTEEVKDSLSQLRTKRDMVGHRNEQADRASVARMLLGSLFGYQYLATYGHLVDPRTAP